MSNDYEFERANARSRALRDGVSGDMPPPQNPQEQRAPTPSGIFGVRGAVGGQQFAAEDRSKRRKKLEEQEEEILKG